MNWMTSAKKRATKWCHEDNQTLSMRGQLSHEELPTHHQLSQKRQLSAMPSSTPPIIRKRQKVSSDIFLLEQAEPMFATVMPPTTHVGNFSTLAYIAAPPSSMDMNSHMDTADDNADVNSERSAHFSSPAFQRGTHIPGGIDALEYTPVEHRRTGYPAGIGATTMELQNENANSILFYNDREPCTELGPSIFAASQSQSQCTNTTTAQATATTVTAATCAATATTTTTTKKNGIFSKFSHAVITTTNDEYPSSVRVNNNDSCSKSITCVNSTTVDPHAGTAISEWNLFQ